MNVGDILFISGKGLISESIELFDQGPFSHVCIAMPHGCILESQYGVNTRIIPNPYPESETTVVSLNLTKEQQDQLVWNAFKYLPYKYDLSEIGSDFLDDAFHMNIHWHHAHEIICSRLAVDMLEDINFFSEEEKQKLCYATPNKELYPLLIKKVGGFKYGA